MQLYFQTGKRHKTMQTDVKYAKKAELKSGMSLEKRDFLAESGNVDIYVIKCSIKRK